MDKSGKTTPYGDTEGGNSTKLELKQLSSSQFLTTKPCNDSESGEESANLNSASSGEPKNVDEDLSSLIVDKTQKYRSTKLCYGGNRHDATPENSFTPKRPINSGFKYSDYYATSDMDLERPKDKDSKSLSRTLDLRTPKGKPSKRYQETKYTSTKSVRKTALYLGSSRKGKFDD